MDFTLYAQLTYLYRNKEIFIHNNKIMKYLNINDNRTLKKSLINLNNLDLIKEQYTTLPTHYPLKITLTQPLKGKLGNFTQLPSSLLTENLIDIKPQGFRLLYYYESFINRSSNKNYANPSLERIVNETNISRNKCIEFNKLLVKKKFLLIKRQRIKSSDLDDSNIVKYNNHYFVQLK